MHHGDLGGELGEEDRLFHRGVAAADHDDLLAAEEEAVAGGAGRHAVAHQHALRLDAERLGGGAGGDDQAVAGVDAPVVAVDLEGAPVELHLEHGLEAAVGPEALRLLAHLVHQVGSHDAGLEAGVVLDVGGDRELAAGLGALEHQRGEVGARGVERRGQAGGAGTDDQQLAMVVAGFGHGRSETRDA